MANVSLRRVSKRFGTVEAVCDLSLTINDGEFVVLLGGRAVLGKQRRFD
jgi:multiple sugar transport system ATP-binding protein